MPQGRPGLRPRSGGGSPRVRPPRGLPEVLRLPERHHPPRAGLLAGRGLQRRDPEVRLSGERAWMVSLLIF